MANELDEITGPNPTEESLEEKELGRVLSEFLRTLPRERRLFFMRRYWFGDSISEISQRFGCSESKVKVTLHRTRTQLKQHLEQEGIHL